MLDGSDVFEPNLVFEDDLNPRFGSLAAQFPDEWAEVLAITGDKFIVYNSQHPIWRDISQEAWMEYFKLKAKLKREALIAGVAQGNRGLAASFLADHVREEGEFWNALHDNFYEELRNIFRLADLVRSSENFKVWKTGYEGGILIVSNAGARFLEGRLLNSASSLLPVPTGSEWFMGARRVPGRRV